MISSDKQRQKNIHKPVKQISLFLFGYDKLVTTNFLFLL